MRKYKLSKWIVKHHEEFSSKREAKITDFTEGKNRDRVKIKWFGKKENKERFNKFLFEITIDDKTALICREELLIWLRQA
jgi:hypothetical protein